MALRARARLRQRCGVTSSCLEKLVNAVALRAHAKRN